MKKFRRSRITTACYVMAALLMVYFIVVSASTLKTIFDYYEPYNVSPGFGETLGYLLQNGLTPFISAVVVFMAGCILNEVRRLNPEYYAADEKAADADNAEQEEADEEETEEAEHEEAAFSAVTDPEDTESAEETEEK